jgi:Zn-dependent protease with chaperone function
MISTCPKCGATIPMNEGYVSWCDKCNWNVQQEDLYSPSNFFEKYSILLARKYGKELFDKISNLETIRPSITVLDILVYIISAAVHSVTAITFITGVLFIIKGKQNYMLYIYGVLMFTLTYLLFPRTEKIEGKILSRKEYPRLYGIVDEIAESIGTQKIDGIIVNEDFNAAFGQFGWKRKSILYVGLPLFSILNAQEKVAIVSHELAHGRNNDINRSLLVYTAVNSLLKWHYALYPDYIFEPGMGILALGAIPFKLVGIGIAETIRLIAYLLAYLLCANKQRAEYFADYIGAEISGTDAMISMLDKLYYGNVFNFTVKRAAINGEQNILFKQFRDNITKIPERESKRIKVLEGLEGARLDATHPLTEFRIKFLMSRPIVKPRYSLNEFNNDKLNDELGNLEQDIELQLVDEYNSYLYNIS